MARYRRTRRSRRSLRRSRRRPRRFFARRTKRRAGRHNLARGQKPKAWLGYLLPKRCAMTTTYSAAVESMDSAAYDEWIINASSIYDPDVTNIGHQAMLFDQMMVLYNRFFVKACRVKVGFLPGSSAVYAATGRVYAIANTTISTFGAFSPSTIREQPRLYQGYWGYQIDGQIWKNIHNFGVNVSSVVPGWSPKNPDCLGSISSGPQGDNCYIHVLITSADESSALVGKWWVQLYYDVEYSSVDDLLATS